MVVRRIGRGGMGAVYEGYDPALDRRVAIKTLTGDAISDLESRSRFEREARAAAKLSHPNIVTIYELGNFGAIEKPYIVMEYLEGTDVSNVMGNKGIPLAEVLDISIQLLHALDFAHQQGVVHRDVKPSNLRYLDSGRLKIMDFGIARSIGGTDQITRSGVMVGTPHYMSPEQIKGQKVDGRSDIFSAGSILYELATGERPFPGDSITGIMYQVVNEEPPPAIEKNPDLPQEIQDVLDQALAKSPGERFTTAGDMALRLQKVLDLLHSTYLRKTPQVEKQLEELDVMRREGNWHDLEPKAKELNLANPQLEEPRRLLRQARRELQHEEQELKFTVEEKTRQRKEILDELSLLYTETRLVPNPKGIAASKSKSIASARSEKNARDRGLILGGLAVVVLLLGFVVWAILSRPAEPKSLSYAMSVVVEPEGAQILVDNVLVGISSAVAPVSVTLSGLPGEVRHFEIRRDRYETREASVILGEELPADLQFALEPLARIWQLQTEPSGATVVLNGTKLEGVTPMRIELPPDGAHKVVLSLEEYRRKTIRVGDSDIPSSDTIPLIALGRPGTLSVRSTYPVAILRGRSTLAKPDFAPSARLRPGRYQITLSAPGVFLREEMEIQIHEQETSFIEAPLLGSMFVRANPGNCIISIDGIEAGAPPFMNMDIVSGNHQFIFTWPDGQTDIQEVQIRQGKPSYVIGQRLQ